MMHLTATAPLPRTTPCGTDRYDPRTRASCSRERCPQYAADRRTGSVFRSAGANFLEFAGAAFHYSVIGRDAAARLAASLSVPAARLPSGFMSAAPGADAQGND
jgi:hypothetical protein